MLTAFVKYGFVRKPTIVEENACIFVSSSVKAVHLVFDLTSEPFIAMFCYLPWVGSSRDHGISYVRADQEFVKHQKTQET